jgi:hypothetical protein
MDTDDTRDSIADEVAELDPAPEPEQPDTADQSEAPELYTGPVIGGPWDGRRAQSRYPRGFLLVDKPLRQAWLYDRRDNGAFLVRSEHPETLDDGLRWTAAEGDAFDLLAIDAETGGDDGD